MHHTAGLFEKTVDMRRSTLKNRLLSIAAVVLPLLTYAQNPSDCSGAIVVCGDTDIDVPDSAGDVLDFNDPDNELGCHITGESSAVWLYFSFRDDMPPGSELRFEITPFEEYNNGEEPDYDFSLYDADLNCDSLGAPLRCSYAWAISNNTFDCGFCPSTGLGNGATDNTEGAFGDGFVAPVLVEPGQGFYLYLNEFPNNADGNSISDGFNISFSGSAAPYLDCGANPNCDQQVVSLGADTTLCSGDVPFLLDAEVSYTTGFETYTWTGFNGEEAFLDDPNSPTPLLTFPDGFSGSATFELEVAAGDCINYDTIVFTVQPTPIIMVDREVTFCEGDSLELDAGPGFASYQWSNSSTEQSITVDQAGTYGVTVSASGNSCTISRQIEVTESPTPVPELSGDAFLCAGAVDTLRPLAAYDNYTWTDGSTDSFLVVDQAGVYGLTVVTEAGCAGSAQFNIQDAPTRSLAIQGPAGLCPETSDTLSAGSWADYQWSSGAMDSLLAISSPGTYSLTVADDFGCLYDNSITVGALPAPQPQIFGDTVFCHGSATALTTLQGYAAYNWSTGDTTVAALATQSGTYEVTVANVQGCTGTDTIQVEELPPLEVSLSIVNDDVLCEGDTVFARVEQSYASYDWEQGVSGPIAPITQGGTYRVTVTDDQGCTAADSITVLENPNPQPDIVGPAGLCPGADGVLQVQPFEIISWNDSSFTSALAIEQAGTYSVTVTDDIGCSAADTIEVEAFEQPMPAITGDTSLCEGGELMFSLPVSYSSYDWGGLSSAPTLTVDTPGSYNVSVANAEGCIGADTVSVAEFSNPALDLPVSEAYCAGDSLTLAAPSIYDGFAWSTGSDSSSTVVNQAGDYSLTVTNTFGCTASDTVEVIENTLPQSGLTGPYRFCAGETLTLAADDSAGDYLWSNGSTNSAIDIDAAGIYTLTITDNNNCQSTEAVELIENPLPQPSILGGSDLCADSSLLLAADDSYAAYAWQGGSTDSTLLVDSPGSYTLSVTDAVGCVGSTSIDIQEVPLPQVGLAGPLAFCEDSTLLIDAGPSFTDYQWSTGAQAQSINVMAAGTYTVTVTDNNGCVNSDSVTASVLPEPPITLQGDSLFCDGASTSLNIEQANYPTVAWSTGGSGNSETFDESGTYGISVVDGNNCSNDTLFNIVELPPVQVSIDGESIVCEGDTAVLQAPAGFEAYTWSTGVVDTTAITVQETGVYRVTVTDSFGCTAASVFGFQVSDYPSLTVPDSLFYCEESTNTLEAVSPDATAFEWSTGDSQPAIEVGSAGEYTVTVTNGFGCSTADSVAVVEIEEPLPFITGDLSLCPNDTAVLRVVDEYMAYAWSTGASEEAIVIESEGSYQVTVTDEYGCSGATNIIVDGVEEADVNIENVDVFCAGDTVLLQANSSNAIGFEWSNGQSGDNLLISAGGQYAVTATNVYGCVAEDVVEVEAFDQPVPGLPDYLADCAGETRSFSAAPGFESYFWNTGATNPTIVTSQSGLYIVTVTDANGCTAVDTTEVFLKPPPNPQITPAQNICQGNSATLQVFGEWSSINWSSGDTTQSIVVDEAGSYGVLVEDSLGCVGASVTLVQLFSVPPPPIDGDEGICPGESTVLSVPEGYDSYEWNNGAQTREIVVDEAGMYEVTVTDTVGCFNSAQFSVKTLELPEVAIDGDPFLCEGASNILTVDTDGDSILWSNGATTPSITINQAGNYGVAVRSTDNCLATDTLAVEDALPPQPMLNDIPALDCDNPSVSLAGLVSGGVFAYQWSGPGISNGSSTLPNPVVSQPGTYTVQVRDSLTGCLSEVLSFELEDLVYTPEAALQVQDTLDCVTPSVSLDGSQSASGSAIVYEWQDETGNWIAGEDGAVYNAVQSGDYTLVVTDTLTGCANTATAFVPANYEIPTAVVNPNVDMLNCIDTVVGLSAVGHASIGTPMFSWAYGASSNSIPGAVETTLDANQPGWYFFIVTDTGNGCQAIDSVLVSQDITPPVANLSVQGTLDCQNNAVSLSPAGSSFGDGFVLEWSGPNGFSSDSAEPQTVNLPGQYTLAVTDISNGCTATANAIVESFDDFPTALNVVLTDPGCLGEENGGIQVASVEGGTAPYVYSLEGSVFSPQTLYTGLASGSYTLTVQDAFGCELDLPITLEAGQDVLLELGDDQSIDYGESVQIIGQTNLNDGEIADIEWEPTDTAACDTCLFWEDQPLESTLYVATITDTAGCTATDEMRVIVRRDRDVYIPNAFSPNTDGKNDLFTVFTGPEVVSVRSLQIFDRWGNQVFSQEQFPPNDPAYGWDGRFRGQAMDIGFFVYFVEVEFEDGQVELYEGGLHLVK